MKEAHEKAKYITLLSAFLLCYVTVSGVNGQTLENNLSGGITTSDNSEVNVLHLEDTPLRFIKGNETKLAETESQFVNGINDKSSSADGQSRTVSNLNVNLTNTRFATQSSHFPEPTNTGPTTSLLSPSAFQHIIGNFHVFADKYQVKDRSCNGRCGISWECSCKPICLFFRTCCVDFREACQDVYNLTEAHMEYQWLEDVDTECVSNSLVVSSCSSRKTLSEGLIQNTFLQGSNISFNSSLHYYYSNKDTASTDDHLPRMKLFKLLWMMSWTANMNLSEAEEILINAPILDRSTGISYKNASVYACNGANISDVWWWNSAIAVTDSRVLALSKLSNTPDIFDLLLTPKRCPYYPSTTAAPKEANVEQCNPEAEQSCPEGYSDHKVLKACEDVTFIIRTRLKPEGNIKIFKNPFCIYCNQDNIQGIVIAQPARLLYTLCEKNILSLSFQERDGKSGLLVENKIPLDSLSPNWRKLHCLIISSKNSTFAQLSKVDMTQISETQPVNLLKLRCQLEKCHFSILELGCEYNFMFILALPRATHVIDDLHMARLQATWIRFLLENVPGVGNGTIDTLTFYVRHDYGFVVLEHEFEYLFYVGLHSEFFGVVSMKRYLREAFIDMIRHLDFPFQQGKNYVCLAIPLSLNTDIRNVECGVRHIDYNLSMQADTLSNGATPNFKLFNLRAWINFTSAFSFVCMFCNLLTFF